MSGRRRVVARIAAGALGVGLALVAVELGLRLAPAVLPSPVQARAAAMPWVARGGGLMRFHRDYRTLWQDDPWLRESLRPGLDVVLEGAPEYPRWRVRTIAVGPDGVGFRTPPQPAPVDAVVLGDSFGFGVGVAEEELFSAVVARHTRLAVANLSQVGASSLHEARIFERYGLPLAPRLVLWLYFQNDLKENLRFAAWLGTVGGLPQASPAGPGLGRVGRILAGRALLAELLLWNRRAGPYRGCRTWVRAGGIEFCRDHDICDPRVQATMLAAGWPLARDALAATRWRAAAIGAELVVVIVPSKEQVFARRYRAAAGLPQDQDLGRLVAPVIRWCAATGVRCLDLEPPLRRAVERGTTPYFAVDIHWNAIGHRVVAEAVEEALAAAPQRQTTIRP